MKGQTAKNYKWWIVFIGGLGIFFSGPGQTYSNSIFINEYVNYFGWSRSDVSLIYSLGTLAAGFLMMHVGKLVDKFGQRRMTLTVAILFGLACIYNSFVTNLFLLFIGFFLIRLLGQGSMTLIPNTLIPHWFLAKRGLAISLMTLGSFLSATIFPVLNEALISSYGWQNTWRILGVSLLVIFFPIAFILVQNRPFKENGQELIIDPSTSIQEVDEEIQNEPISALATRDWTVDEAKKTATFRALIACVGIPALVNTAITFHIVSIFQTNGLTAQNAAVVLSMMAFMGFPVTLIAGRLVDRIPLQFMLVTVFILEIVFLVVLLNLTNVTSSILFAVIWGIANGVERIVLTMVWPNFFGLKHSGSFQGIGATLTVLGSSLGPLPLGLAYDYFQNYQFSLLILIALPVIGLIASTRVKPLDKISYTH
ncbi:MFS transporter [Carnobacterium sp. ISL-102]|uniref:MFS transporter n=1 Tax=Carnobacterium sp. ISL-102 TaxID=2819142 RepID=UPI001BEB60E6|nr:MFS transporter [Carnobacterium sp. ISL-102]MBT2731751.1 MFS transporter [Carnobacterium sp. ISL-102]